MHRLLFKVVLLVSVTGLFGCLSTPQRADRAFKAGNCDAALKLYEEEITNQTRDPNVYYKAGQCALRLGAFTQSERYYSRSLRYGGGPVVAKALAKLYIKTSNYTRAVKVLQALLNDERVKPQPVYNNLGTALMYAGEPMDAESYLLLAQQLNPKDPFPYVNLGLLYDKHLKKPALAMGFYTCYLNLMKKAPQARTVRLRLRELKLEQHTPSTDVTCGKVYKPTAPESNAYAKLQALKARAKKEDASLAANGNKKDPTTPSKLGPGAKDNTVKTSKIVVQKGGELPPEKAKPVTTPTDTWQKARQLAQKQFYDKQYKDALVTLNGMPSEALLAPDALLLAKTHRALGQKSQAEVWYRLAFQKAPNALYFQSLLEFLRAEKKTKQLKTLCKKYANQDTFAPAMSLCS